MSIDKDMKELHTDNRALQKELRTTYIPEAQAEIRRTIAENNRQLKALDGEKVNLMGGPRQAATPQPAARPKAAPPQPAARPKAAPQQPVRPPIKSFIGNSGNSSTPLSQLFGLTF